MYIETHTVTNGIGLSTSELVETIPFQALVLLLLYAQAGVGPLRHTGPIARKQMTLSTIARHMVYTQ